MHPLPWTGGEALEDVSDVSGSPSPWDREISVNVIVDVVMFLVVAFVAFLGVSGLLGLVWMIHDARRAQRRKDAERRTS